jgi:hypothetical protein
MIADVDAWMPKHFDDALDEPPVVAATGYRILQDFAPDSGLPWLFNGHGNRFVAYATESLSGLLDWLGGEVARESIEDGAERESQYPLLDGEPFTGNIYVGESVLGAIDAEFAGESSILVQRFHVGDQQEANFKSWLADRHAPAWAALESIQRVRTFAQAPKVPNAFPYTRYVSKGNVMMLADFTPGASPREVVREARTLLMDSVRWDVELPYVRREIGECFALRTKANAQATLGERRSTKEQT